MATTSEKKTAAKKIKLGRSPNSGMLIGYAACVHAGPPDATFCLFSKVQSQRLHKNHARNLLCDKVASWLVPLRLLWHGKRAMENKLPGQPGPGCSGSKSWAKRKRIGLSVEDTDQDYLSSASWSTPSEADLQPAAADRTRVWSLRRGGADWPRRSPWMYRRRRRPVWMPSRNCASASRFTSRDVPTATVGSSSSSFWAERGWHLRS